MMLIIMQFPLLEYKLDEQSLLKISLKQNLD
jgi:hypothetical protein